jgi:hypothetical protein
MGLGVGKPKLGPNPRKPNPMGLKVFFTISNPRYMHIVYI